MYFVVRMNTDNENNKHVCLTKDPSGTDTVLCGPLPHDEAEIEMERYWVQGERFPNEPLPGEPYERLRAAAPDLLAALEALMVNTWGLHRMHPVMVQARAAIAKACQGEGRGMKREQDQRAASIGAYVLEDHAYVPSDTGACAFAIPGFPGWTCGHGWNHPAHVKEGSKA